MKRAVALALAGALASSVALPARALPRDHQLALDVGLSVLRVEDKSTASTGLGVGLHYTYGLTDALNLDAMVMRSVVAASEAGGPQTPRTRPETVSHAAVGMTYVLDTLSWVPYGGLLLGGAALDGGTLAGTKLLPDLVLALGLDYRVPGTPLTFGAAWRQHIFMDEPSTYPSFMQIVARAALRF